MPLDMPTMEWILGLKKGDEVGIFNAEKLIAKQRVRDRYDDAIILENKQQFDEYGTEIVLGNGTSKLVIRPV